MYYTAILEHDTRDENCYQMLHRTPSSKITQLKSAVPGFFNNQDAQPGKVHVLILCADNEESWTDHRLKAEFDIPGTLHIQTPESPSTVQASYCFSVGNDVSSVYDVIKETAQKVKCCFGDDYSLARMASILETALGNNTGSWSAELAKNFSELLSDGIDQAEKKHTLYLLILMPKDHFSDFKGLHLPLFIEYVVQGQAEDPDMEIIRSDLEQKSQALEVEKRENKELLMALKEISEVVQEIKRGIDDMIIRIQNLERQYDPQDSYYYQVDQVKEDIKDQLVVLRRIYAALKENCDKVERKYKRIQLNTQ